MRTICTFIHTCNKCSISMTHRKSFRVFVKLNIYVIDEPGLTCNEDYRRSFEPFSVNSHYAFWRCLKIPFHTQPNSQSEIYQWWVRSAAETSPYKAVEATPFSWLVCAQNFLSRPPKWRFCWLAGFLLIVIFCHQCVHTWALDQHIRTLYPINKR